MTEFQERVVKLLAKGMTQQDVSDHLTKKGFTPSSLSSVEKEFKKLKCEYKAKSSFHLAVILKNRDII